MPEIIITLGDSVVSRYVFEKDIVSVGRSRDNEIVIENLAISRNHARIRNENGRFFISDLNSANGTFVNGAQITKAELFHGDVIAVGKHKLVFKNEVLSDEAMISDAFGAERTMVVPRVPVATLRVTRGKQKDQEFRIDKAEVTIGRGKGCPICLQDWFVGKEHAVIQRRGETFVLRDVGSWRGTKVNDRAITETVLKDGDEIQIGGTRLAFHIGHEETPPLTPRRAPSEVRKISGVEAAPLGPPAEKEPGEVLVAREGQPLEAAEARESVKIPERGPLDFLREEQEEEGEVLFRDLDEELSVEPRKVGEAAKPKPVPAERPTPVEIRPEPVKESAKPVQPQPAQAAERGAPKAEPSTPSRVSLDEIRLWEEALKNKSSIIRKQAAKMLKKMTGRDHGE